MAFYVYYFQDLTAFEVCLVGLMLFFGLTCIMLIIGVQKHAHQLIYPSLLARGLTTLFLAVFGVSTVFSSTRSPHAPADMEAWRREKNHANDEPNMALRLVLFVFAMLFLTVIIFYCSYLVVRLIHYEQAYARLKERRSSLIQAGMIGMSKNRRLSKNRIFSDPDFPSPNNYSASRRASSA